MVLKVNRFIIYAFILLYACPAYSQNYAHGNNWNCLGLSDYQKQQMQILDCDWKSSVNELRPQIQQAQKLFNKKYYDSKTREFELRKTYLRLIGKQQELKQHALEIYLAKRRLLTPSQMKIMQKGCR